MRRRRGARAGPRRLAEPADWYALTRHAVGRAHDDGAAQAEGATGSAATSPAWSRRSARTSPIPTRRRGLRREDRRARRVRLRSRGRRRAEAGEPHVRGGRGSSGRGAHRAAGPPRPGAAPAGAERAGQRRRGRRGHVRRADRQGARRARSPPSAARGTSSSCARSAPTTSSTTRRRTSRGAASVRPDARRRGRQVVVGLKRVLDPKATLVIVGAPQGTACSGRWQGVK